MAKEELKIAYDQVMKDLNQQIEQILSKAKQFEDKGMEGEENSHYYYRIATVNIYLDTIEILCKMNEYELQLMKKRNENALKQARNIITNVLRILESIVGTNRDTLSSDENEVFTELKRLNPKKILHLVKKLDYAIALLEKEEGDKSKYYWNIIDSYGRFVVIAKNLVNFKKYSMKIYDPNFAFYEELNELIRIVMKIISTGSEKLLSKYELYTKDPTDINRAIDYQKLLLSIYRAINGDQFKMEQAKKIITAWNERLENDLKNMDKKKRDQFMKKTSKTT